MPINSLLTWSEIIKNNAQLFLRYGLIKNSLRLDASTICQLKCPECSQAKGEVGVVGKGYLRFNHFKQFVDQNRYFKNIELSSYGEIFLNPDLVKICAYAYRHRIQLTAYNGVNLNTLKDDVAEALVKYHFQILTVSIDGAVDEIYNQYRRGGNLQHVLDNIRKINYYKAKYQSPYPKLIWQFIVFGHNVQDIERARQLADELNMAFKTKLNWNPAYSPVKKPTGASDGSRQTITSRQEYQSKKKVAYFPPCQQFWFSPQINWDGKLLGCCANKWVSFGNVFEDGLRTCLKNSAYRRTKKALLGKTKMTNDLPCAHCNIYDKVGQASKGNPFKTLKFLTQRRRLL